MAVNKKKSKATSKAKGSSSLSGDAELDAVISKIEGEFGKGTIMTGDTKPQPIPRVETDILGLDLILGGGVPKGRIVEVYGPESSGKTSLALTLCGKFQENGEKVAFIDAEHALDPVYAGSLGLDVSKMLTSQPDYGEQALEVAEALIRSGKVGCLVIDSVSALTPKAEIEGTMGQSHMGAQARLMSQALRKLVGVINESNTTVIFINQLRSKIGVMFGNPETTSGGNALKFYASLRLDVRRIGSIKEGDKVVANQVRIKTVKNKTAPPFQEVELEIRLGQGYDKVGDLVNQGVIHGVINKAGTWLNYGDIKEQGKSNLMKALKEQPKVLKEIRKQVTELAAMSPEERAELKEKAITEAEQEEKPKKAKKEDKEEEDVA